jgi:hypothetical protein
MLTTRHYLWIAAAVLALALFATMIAYDQGYFGTPAVEQQ